MTTVRIVGIGSGLGPDQAGWLALDHLKQCRWLREMAGHPVSLHECALPTDLPNLLAGSDVAILIDATIGPAGGVQVLDGEQLSGESDRLSTHGFDVRQALGLMEALGEQPGRVVLIAIGGGQSGADPPGLSTAPTLDALTAGKVEQELRNLLSGVLPDQAGPVGFQAPQQ